MRALIKIAYKKNFEEAKKDLDEKGVKHYSMHKRIAIPKKNLALSDLEKLKFRKSYSGIPEPGQKKFVSYRHPDRYHIHDHGSHWMMHRDSHNPVGQTIKDKVKHIKDEALPSLGDYFKWKDGPILEKMIGDV